MRGLIGQADAGNNASLREIGSTPVNGSHVVPHILEVELTAGSMGSRMHDVATNWPLTARLTDCGFDARAQAGQSGCPREISERVAGTTRACLLGRT
jgi:hypothetical protein